MGIRTTHPYAPPPVNVSAAVDWYVRRHGVKQFLADAVRGDLDAGHNGIVPRLAVLTAVNHNSAVRGLVSRYWRQEDPHTHEWVPCTYLCHIAARAIVAADFRFLLLADAMRTPTQSLVFKPRVVEGHRVATRDPGRNRATPIVLQAHPGGLRFHDAPAWVYPTQLTRFNHNVFLTGYSQTFHDDIIHALAWHGTAAQMLADLHTVFTNHIWNGTFPVNGHNAGDLWKWYQRGDGTVVNAGNFAAFCGAIAVEHAAANANFTGAWQAIATGHGRLPPVFWP